MFHENLGVGEQRTVFAAAPFSAPNSATRQATDLPIRGLVVQDAHMHENPVRIEGLIDQVLQAGIAQVLLPNGKHTLGHLSRELREENPTLRTGMKVQLEMTPFDFDKARIVSISKPPASSED